MKQLECPSSIFPSYFKEPSFLILGTRAEDNFTQYLKAQFNWFMISLSKFSANSGYFFFSNILKRALHLWGNCRSGNLVADGCVGRN